MPQLTQIDSFVGQIFWLTIFFFLLYLLMVKLVLPRLSEILEARRYRLEGDLASARKHSQEAQAILAKVEQLLHETKEQARQNIADAEQALQATHQAQMQELDAQLQSELGKAEQALAKQVKNAKTDIADHSKLLASDIITKLSGKTPDAKALDTLANIH